MGTSIIRIRTTDRMTGMCFFVNGGTALTQAQPEYPDLCIGRPIVFTPNTPDRLYPGQPHSTIAFQSPSVHGKDTSKAREIHLGQGCGYSGTNSYEPQVISKKSREFKDQSQISTKLKGFQTSTRTLPPNCVWNSCNWDRIESVLRPAGTKVSTSLQHKSRATQDHCSRPIGNREFFKNIIEKTRGWTNVCIMQFPAELRQNSVEWSDCRRNRQGRRQIASKVRPYPIRKIANPQIVP